MLAAEMEPRQNLHPAGAGAVLLGATIGGILLGALIGWALGSWTIGALVGAILGIPAGVFAVYRRYRGAFA
jgi:F0F1-type ATP synthase assembly protein I